MPGTASEPVVRMGLTNHLPSCCTVTMPASSKAGTRSFVSRANIALRFVTSSASPSPSQPVLKRSATQLRVAVVSPPDTVRVFRHPEPSRAMSKAVPSLALRATWSSTSTVEPCTVFVWLSKASILNGCGIGCTAAMSIGP